AQDRAVLDSGKVAFEEERDGRQYLSTKFPLRNAQDEPYAVCGIVADITGLREAETQLKEREVLLHAMVESISAIVVIRDLDGRYLLVNRFYEEAVGIPREKLVGMTDH